MSANGILADMQPICRRVAATMDDAQNTAANDPGIIRIEGIESAQIPVAPHLETVIRCKRAALIVHGGDGSREVVIRNAVIRIEGDPDTEPGR